MMATKIKIILELTIEPDQKGNLKCCKITDNLLNIRAVQQSIEQQNTNQRPRKKTRKTKAAILGPDFQKTYDEQKRVPLRGHG